MRREIIEKLIGLAGEITNSLNILRLGHQISESNCDEERVLLAQALTNLLRADHNFDQFKERNQGGYYGTGMF